jgi:hypothetical protein
MFLRELEVDGLCVWLLDPPSLARNSNPSLTAVPLGGNPPTTRKGFHEKFVGQHIGADAPALSVTV